MQNLIKQFQKDAIALKRDANSIEELKRWIKATEESENLEDYVYDYLSTALWASGEDEEGELLDLNYDTDDFSPETIEKAKQDLREFEIEAGETLKEAVNEMGYGYEDVAHDFWMTRNGHGVGFWDRTEIKGQGKTLAGIAKTFPEVNVFVGDDGKLIIE